MSRTTSRMGQAPRSSRAKRRQNGIVVFITSLVLIVGVVGYLGLMLMTKTEAPADFAGAGNEETVLIEVKEGASLSVLAPEMVANGVVASEQAFRTAAANAPNASSLKPGFYRLKLQQSAKTAVEALLSDDSRVSMLRIPGGATLSDVVVVGGDVRYGIFSMISQVTCAGEHCIQNADLEQVAAMVDPAALGAPAWALDQVRARGDDPKRLEGLIAPGEYILDPNANAQEILTDLVTRSAKLYNDTHIAERAQAINLSPYELLTAASLVEREAPAGEFDKVARVILNRLAEPMRLEFDSTVNYGLPDVELATTDEARNQVTPWNTYAKDGLPDTPIASPSNTAISAMENPAEGNWKFFVTVDKDGTTKFSENFDEHLGLVDEARNNGVLDSQRGN